MPIHRTSNHAERPGYPSAHIAIATSMMPEARPSPQSGIRSRSTMLRMMSKKPLNSRYQPISRARIPNVWNGEVSAMIPATTNSTPSSTGNVGATVASSVPAQKTVIAIANACRGSPAAGTSR